MTNEQREAINRLKKLVRLRKSKNTIKYDNCICSTEDLDTALSLIKELQKENDLAKEQLKKQCEIADERNNLLVKVNRLESQIDLMAEYIATLDIDEDICMNNKINSEWCNEDYTNCKKCIKQYFERKVKNVKNKR